MKVVVKYFYTICQFEQKKEIIRQMIAEYFDDKIETPTDIFKSRSEFLDFIFPYRVKSLNRLGENKNITYCNYLISELMNTEQEMESLLEQHRNELSQTDILQIYKDIDPTSDGYFDTIKLQKYLTQNCNLNTSTDDIINIFRRIDLDNDGYISLAEFLNEFQKQYKQHQSQISTMAQTRQQSTQSSQQQFSPPYSEDCHLFALFIKQLLETKITPEILLENKKSFLRKKQQSFLTLFEYLAHSIYIDIRDLESLLQYYKLKANNNLEEICLLFNKEQPNQIEFKDFLNFFTF